MFLVSSILGCGVVGNGPPPPPPNIIVAVAPAAASVLLGESQSFTASVSNATNTAVTWSVNGIPGGNAATGTIDAAGVYTAPANLPAPAPVSVQAASVENPAKIGTSAVTVTSDISVSISPQSAAVELGAVQSFAAAVNSAGAPNRAVTWMLSSSGCSGASCGTVNSSGTYTAPPILPSPPGVSLTAISVADPSKSAAAAITVTSSFSLALTGPPSATAGGIATYLAAITPAANSNPSRVIVWSVTGTGCSGTTCGSVSSTGVYTAPPIPPSPATVQIIATAQADPTKAASLPVLIVPAVSVSISPTSASVALGSTRALQATVTGALDATVTWDVNGVVGGDATMGLIFNSQTDPDNTTYTAPQTAAPGGSVTVHARSNADPSVSASATITFMGGVGVTLTPATAMLAVQHRQTFRAAVNDATNQNVSWLVNGIAGGNPTTGQICVAGSNPCLPISASNGGSVDYIAPAGLPTPDPVTITATSLADGTMSASASVTILNHVAVSVLPGNATLAGGGQQRFTASVAGTENQLVIWTIAGAACGISGACGSIDSTGLYTAPASPPSPEPITVVATSSEDTSQSASATVTITGGPAIFSLAPTSAYAGTAGGFTLLVTGNNFSPTVPGPASTILVTSTARTTSCASSTQCITSLSEADLQFAGNLTVQVQNPDGTLSNTVTFVALAQGTSTSVIPLTPSSPTSAGNDIVVVDLTTNGGSGAAGNVSLNVAALGAFSVATSSCALGGAPIVLKRPASGNSTGDLCVFSVSALDPSFTYTVTGPSKPDVTVIDREPLGLGILHLTLLVPATAAPGPRTLFIANPEGDKAAGTGAIEVQ